MSPTRPQKLSDQHKLPGRTAAEIVRAFNLYLADLQADREVLFNRRKLTGEALVAAVMLDFFALPADQRTEIVRRRVPQFEAILRGVAPPDEDAGAADDFAGPAGTPPRPAPGRAKGR